MRPRHAVLLTPSESALPSCLPFFKQIAPVTPLESALTNHSQLIENTATLSLVESALTKTRGVEGILPVPERFHLERSQGAITLKFFLFTLLRTLLHSRKTQPFSFQALAHSLPKTTRGGDGACFLFPNLPPQFS
jgi:hypothetical protein